MILERWFGLEAKRKRLLKRVPPGALRDYLSVPFPSPKQGLHETRLLCLDFETTGLHPQFDKILSVGYCPMQRGQISLRGRYHRIVKIEGALKDANVAVHKITEQDKARGAALAEVVESLLAALCGRVMLVHYAQIERSFLQRACSELYGVTPVFPMIDTIVLAKRRLDKSLVAYDPSQLRLPALRAEHKLAPHFEHNALNDAVATGELLLAELSAQQIEPEVRLEQLLLR
ncbi:MAG: exonuclease domain-containing protein [Pseudomonadales bacterium]